MNPAEERLGHDPTSELWGEHRARYRFAAQWVAGQRVLDIACGAGFGLTMLRAAGARAVGMDVDASALYAMRAEDRSVALAAADAARLPLPDASIDLITSFETLEHVPNARAMVYELRRVLRPGGTLVLSTPNRSYGPPARHQNPFHIQEFTASELTHLLDEAFADVAIFGQRPSDDYQFVPYLMLESRWTPAEVTWKLLNRLPFHTKDGLARALTGRSFYPSEGDYEFRSGATDGANTLLATAR